MQEIRDLTPFQQENVGSQRLRKFLSFALVLGLFQLSSFGIQIVSAPGAQAASTGTPLSTPVKVSPIPGGGPGSSNCPTGSVLYEIFSSREPIDGSSALTNTYGNCANLNTAGTQINAWTQKTTTFGGAVGNTPQNEWCGGAGSTRAIAGARVFKTTNNYSAGLRLICKDLPNASSTWYWADGNIIGTAPTANEQDLICPDGYFAVGLNVHAGSIIDAFGFNCGAVIDATQSPITSVTLSMTSKTYPYSFNNLYVDSIVGGSGSGDYIISAVSNGTATGCAYSGVTISSSTSGTCSLTVTKTADLNYAATSRTETFTFNKASLTITASSPIVNFGNPIPTITPSYSGFVNSENSSSSAFTTGLTAPTCTTSYTTTSTVDTSPTTTCSGGSSTGYSFSYVTGRVLILSGLDKTISLNGTNQQLVTPDNSNLDIAGAISLEAWVNPSNASARFTVAGKWLSYMLAAYDGKWHYWMGNSSDWSAINTGVPVVANEWQHVAFTRAASTNSVNFYVNGALVYTGTAGLAGTGDIRNTSSSFTIGSHNEDSDFFPGKIDEVRLWNVVRSQSDIQTDLKTWGPANSSGLVAYYDFNEIVGNTTVYNRSSTTFGQLDLTSRNSPTISNVETTTVNQAYTVVTFPRNYLTSKGGWTSPVNRQLRALVVGGGGGGNRGVCAVNYGAGGGGGQAIETRIASSGVFSVLVGSGGAKATGSCDNTSGTNGGSSSFGSTTSVGGTAALYNSRVGGSSGSNIGGTSTLDYGAGGGGGAGGVGDGINGGPGYLFSITGLTYGGGGAGRNNTYAGTASGGGATPSTQALVNRGGGGTDWYSGSSGVVIVGYISDTPTILIQPLSDTTTAGIVETFTITTSVAPTPLTKSVQWQFTADTTTGTSGWTNSSSGTGGTTDTFTTAALTKSMNKYRFRAIVTFSDTATLSVVETSSVVILTINDSITITSLTSTITRKYGDSQTLRTITYTGGTTESGTVGTSISHTVRGAYGTQASDKIILDTSTSTVVFRVDTGTVVGSYVETITVTDFKGATATYTQRVVVNPADTLTVQADTLTAITYGESLSPTYTASGFVNGDSIATISYGHVSCANGGKCAIGDIGPGGGVVFYVSQSTTDSQTAISGYTSGGIYLEAAPVGWGNGIAVAAGETTGTNYLDPVVNWCNTAFDFNSKGTGIGLGGDNSKKMDTNCSSGAGQIAVDLVLNGKNDWYLPSQDELTQMGVQKNLIGLLYGVNNCYGSTCYWSSTQNGGGSSVRGLQVTSSSATMGNNDTLLTASNKVMVRPIRAFSPITNNSETVTASAPTAAGTYVLRPTAITLTNNVDTSNYVSVVFRSSQSTILRATQSPKISMQNAKGVYDTGTATLPLTSVSGLGTGAVFYLIGAGSAASCSISGSTLSITSEGVCNVLAFKQASTNYLYDSATVAAVITFTRFISNQQVQVQLYPTMIPINGANALETTTLTVPIITSVVYDPGGRYLVDGNFQVVAPFYTINGSGFTGATRVVLNFNDLAPFALNSDTKITFNAGGITSGILFIECSDGRLGPTPFYDFTP